MEPVQSRVRRKTVDADFGDPSSTQIAYGRGVSGILALDQHGNRLMPLVAGGCSSQEARALLLKHKASDLFVHSRDPAAALGGLWLYFSAFEECHEIVQNVASAEGSFWHGIAHRQEPDAGNAAYWFRRVGGHAVFPELRDRADQIAQSYPECGLQVGRRWDPLQFIEFVEIARAHPGSAAERAALEMQRAEWQLLFDYCARSGS